MNTTVPASVYAQRRAHLIGQRIRPHRLTGLGPAQAKHMPPRRLFAEIVIKADDAMNFRPRQPQRGGDHRLGLVGNEPPFGLNIVQDRQKRPLAVTMRGDDRPKAFGQISGRGRFGHGWAGPGSLQCATRLGPDDSHNNRDLSSID